MTAVLLSTVSISMRAQEQGHGAIIDDAKSLAVPIKHASDVSPLTKSIAEISPSAVMLNTPPIGNQYSQGSCCAWAVGYAACGILSYDKYGQDWDVARRSPSFLYNQLKDAGDSECKSGFHIVDALSFISRNGICSYKSMPYISNSCTEMPDASQNREASFNKFTYNRVDNSNLVGEIKAYLRNGIPVMFDFEVSEDYYDAVYSDGVIDSYSNAGATSAHACTCLLFCRL